jgi:hypothetical protein
MQRLAFARDRHLNPRPTTLDRPAAALHQECHAAPTEFCNAVSSFGRVVMLGDGRARARLKQP